MNVISLLFSIANFAVGVIVLLCCILAMHAMTGKTKHCIRFVYWWMGVSAFILCCAPFSGNPELVNDAHLMLCIGLSAYLLFDRRRYDKLMSKFTGFRHRAAGTQ